jgi:hypothetical protein
MQRQLVTLVSMQEVRGHENNHGMKQRHVHSGRKRHIQGHPGSSYTRTSARWTTTREEGEYQIGCYQRAFPDKPDFLILHGWPKNVPPPTEPTKISPVPGLKVLESSGKPGFCSRSGKKGLNVEVSMSKLDFVFVFRFLGFGRSFPDITPRVYPPSLPAAAPHRRIPMIIIALRSVVRLLLRVRYWRRAGKML